MSIGPETTTAASGLWQRRQDLTEQRVDRRVGEREDVDLALRRAAGSLAQGARWLRACLWTDQPERVARLDAEMALAAAGRDVAWVSAEGVGVAPTVPTLGDRHASGHSIIGLAVFDRTGRRDVAVGGCWSKGHSLAWPADS